MEERVIAAIEYLATSFCDMAEKHNEQMKAMMEIQKDLIKQNDELLKMLDKRNGNVVQFQ